MKTELTLLGLAKLLKCTKQTAWRKVKLNEYEYRIDKNKAKNGNDRIIVLIDTFEVNLLGEKLIYSENNLKSYKAVFDNIELVLKDTNGKPQDHLLVVPYKSIERKNFYQCTLFLINPEEKRVRVNTFLTIHEISALAMGPNPEPLNIKGWSVFGFASEIFTQFWGAEPLTKMDTSSSFAEKISLYKNENLNNVFPDSSKEQKKRASHSHKNLGP